LLASADTVSAPAIASKLAHLAHYPAVFVICGEKLLSIPPGGLLEENQKMWGNLAIEYAFSTSSFNYRLKRFHPIPSTHLIQQAFDNRDGCNGDDLFPFSNPQTKWKCYVDCFIDGNRVYGILYQNRPIKNENQLSLL